MSALQELLQVMRRLRAANGCAWDRRQTSQSLTPYIIEEAYETVAAIESLDGAELCDELGDLLFQIVFQAQIASELGQFDFDAVAASIRDKLIRRHPHVFAAQPGVNRAPRAWEDIKAAERAARISGARPLSHLEGVPSALPAVLRAYKLSTRAARVGFDFERADQTADKVDEELAEVRAAACEHSEAREPQARQSAERRVYEEMGDLMFAVVNLARKLDIDAESALRSANSKFERRFRGMEALALERGENFADLDLAAQERLWQDIKRGE